MDIFPAPFVESPAIWVTKKEKKHYLNNGDHSQSFPFKFVTVIVQTQQLWIIWVRNDKRESCLVGRRRSRHAAKVCLCEGASLQ